MILNIRLSKIKSESEKRNIELQIESAAKFNIWYSIFVWRISNC